MTTQLNTYFALVCTMEESNNIPKVIANWELELEKKF